MPDGLSAVCRLYDSHLHLVVMAGSAIDEFGDLEGKRVSLGARDSGTEFTSLRVLGLGRVNADGRYLSQAESAAALRDGEIDAMFSLTGVPTPAITDLAQRHPIRLIPLDEQADALVTAYPGSYAPAMISATAYAGVPATRTVAVPNVLLVRNDLPDDLVYAITDTIFTHTGTIASAAATTPRPFRRRGRSTCVPGSPPRRSRSIRARPPGSATASADDGATAATAPAPTDDGSVTTAANPCPDPSGRGRPSSSRSSPPAAPTRSAQIARPRPVPGTFWCRGDRQNRRSAWARSDASSPRPSSRTAI